MPRVKDSPRASDTTSRGACMAVAACEGPDMCTLCLVKVQKHLLQLNCCTL
jgi:hypothetical protein